jgi:hypothetical protein
MMDGCGLEGYGLKRLRSRYLTMKIMVIQVVLSRLPFPSSIPGPLLPLGPPRHSWAPFANHLKCNRFFLLHAT